MKDPKASTRATLVEFFKQHSSPLSALGSNQAAQALSEKLETLGTVHDFVRGLLCRIEPDTKPASSAWVNGVLKEAGIDLEGWFSGNSHKTPAQRINTCMGLLVTGNGTEEQSKKLAIALGETAPSGSTAQVVLTTIKVVDIISEGQGVAPPKRAVKRPIKVEDTENDSTLDNGKGGGDDAAAAVAAAAAKPAKVPKAAAAAAAPAAAGGASAIGAGGGMPIVVVNASHSMRVSAQPAPVCGTGLSDELLRQAYGNMPAELKPFFDALVAGSLEWLPGFCLAEVAQRDSNLFLVALAGNPVAAEHMQTRVEVWPEMGDASKCIWWIETETSPPTNLGQVYDSSLLRKRRVRVALPRPAVGVPQTERVVDPAPGHLTVSFRLQPAPAA